MTTVAGVDGTGEEGWIVVQLTDQRLVYIQRLETLEAVLEATREAPVVAVNLAVGHEDPAGSDRDGRRRCDELARERFGADRPDLPLVPPPAVLEEPTLEDAQGLARQQGWPVPGSGLWRLRDRLVALDDVAGREHLFEVRTELSFQAMLEATGGSGRLPMPPYSWKGLSARLRLLADQGLRPARSLGGVGHLSPKDAVAATAAAWTALRIADDQASSLPVEPPRDPRTQRPVAIHT